MTCLAPRCTRPRAAPNPFCALHQQSPPGRRGGWLSARRRRSQLAGDVEIDASQIIDRLWVGSRPPFDRPLPGFSMLVLCAEELQPTHLAFRGRVVRCPIYDANPFPTQHVHRALQAARAVVDEHRRGGRVLVTCAAGLNRSALVASMAILQITRRTPVEVVELVRERRAPAALCNPAFVLLLHSLRRVTPP